MKMAAQQRLPPANSSSSSVGVVGIGGVHDWYHENDASNATCTSNSTNLTPNTDTGYIASAESNAPMSIDGLMAVSTNVDGNKYLDLDACKVERKYDTSVSGCSLTGSNSSIQQSPASPGNSCSFSGGIGDNSLGGVYSNSSGALNIRTDEKMPAKGEISEQESICDIENSWSQPVSYYCYRFGIFPMNYELCHIYDCIPYICRCTLICRLVSLRHPFRESLHKTTVGIRKSISLPRI